MGKFQMVLNSVHPLAMKIEIVASKKLFETEWKNTKMCRCWSRKPGAVKTYFESSMFYVAYADHMHKIQKNRREKMIVNNVGADFNHINLYKFV